MLIFDALEAERAECLSGVIRDWVERTATHGHGAAMADCHCTAMHPCYERQEREQASMQRLTDITDESIVLALRVTIAAPTVCCR